MFWREVVLFFPVLYDFVSCFIVDVMIMPFVHASLGVFHYSTPFLRIRLYSYS